MKVRNYFKKLGQNTFTPIINKLETMRLGYILLMSILASEVLTTIVVLIMATIFRRRITYDYIITGMVAALICAALIVSIILLFIKQLQETKAELKRAYVELKSTQEQLIHSEKMATIGTLAGGIAHEINNPLGAILTSTQTLLMDIKDEGERESLKLIEDSTRRCRDIVQTLLRYSRKPEVGEFESIDLNAVIIDSCNLLQHQLEKDNIKIETEYGSIPYMRGNANELQQVFTNLILNAGDAVKEKRKIEDKRKIKDTEKPGKITIRTSQKGKFIVSQIIDNGIGIPEENIKRIFDPFFTTKDVGGGTGLGLSITYKIIEKHSGEIGVSSKVREGTIFTIRLPIEND